MTEENKTKNNSEEIVTGSDSVVKEVTPKKKRKRKFILLYVAVFVFAVYAVYALITQYSQIDKKKSQLAELNKKISVQEIKNDEITNILLPLMSKLSKIVGSSAFSTPLTV